MWEFLIVLSVWVDLDTYDMIELRTAGYTVEDATRFTIEYARENNLIIYTMDIYRMGRVKDGTVSTKRG